MPTGWKVRGSVSGGGEIFRTYQTGPGVQPVSCKSESRVSFPGLRWLERSVDHPPHLSLRLKKEYSYTFTPLWDFLACSGLKFTFHYKQKLRSKQPTNALLE